MGSLASTQAVEVEHRSPAAGERQGRAVELPPIFDRQLQHHPGVEELFEDGSGLLEPSFVVLHLKDLSGSFPDNPEKGFVQTLFRHQSTQRGSDRLDIGLKFVNLEALMVKAIKTVLCVPMRVRFHEQGLQLGKVDFELIQKRCFKQITIFKGARGIGSHASGMRVTGNRN